MRRLCPWRGRATVPRRAAADDRYHLVLIDQFCREACRFFRTALVILDHDVDAPAVNASGLVNVIGGHKHAVDPGLSEVESWTTQIAEVTDFDRAAVWLICVLSGVARAGKRQCQHHQHDRKDYLL